MYLPRELFGLPPVSDLVNLLCFKLQANFGIVEANDITAIILNLSDNHDQVISFKAK